MKHCFVVLLLFLSFINTEAQKGYPVPAKTDKMLFYLQRTHNKNTIVYDMNLLDNGRLNLDNPINIYWIRYEEGGKTAPLSYIQEKAFGVHYKVLDKNKESILLQFNKFKKRDIYLMRTAMLHYKAFMNINGELAELDHVYIQSKTNSLGIPLSVEYVELYGVSSKTGKSVYEKFVP
jgi:hypothetical protein